MGTARQNIGSTPAQIASIFNARMASNFGRVNYNSLRPDQWTMLAHVYPGDLTALMPVSAVIPRAKYVLARTRAQPIIPIPPTLGNLGALQSTVQEIYLDFLLFGGAPSGGIYAPLAPEIALYATTVFVAFQLTVAFGAGYALGTWLYNFSRANLPEDLNPLMAPTEYIDAVANMVSWVQTGSPSGPFAEYSLNEGYFGIPLSELNNASDFGAGQWGPWGVFDDASFFFDESSFCVNPLQC
jgi:hypothetical protein